MGAIRIVEKHHLLHKCSKLPQVGEGSIEQVFILQNSDKPLCKGIIITITNFTHAWQDMMILEQCSVDMAAVLKTVIAVVDEGLTWCS